MVRLAVVVLLLLLPGLQVRAEYLVGRGDVLRVAIEEIDSDGTDAVVNADGRIMLPQVGSVAVAGIGLDAIRAGIEAELARREIVRSAVVTVEVARYRPFYVGGAVAQPGAIDYAPGLTVRHALLLAGGVAREIAREPLSGTELLGLKAKWQATSYALLQVESRIARLEAELALGKAPDLDKAAPGAVGPQDVEAIRSLEAGMFGDRMFERETGQAHLRGSVALVDHEIEILAKQAALQDQERALQHQQVESAQTLLAKGLVPLSRVQELQRAESAVARDFLENEAFAARARQAKADAQYQVEAADAKWRIDIRGELSAALLERARLKSELEVASVALISAGVNLADPRSKPAEPQVTIYRTVQGGDEVIPAGLGTEIAPGDIVEVALTEAPAG